MSPLLLGCKDPIFFILERNKDMPKLLTLILSAFVDIVT